MTNPVLGFVQSLSDQGQLLVTDGNSPQTADIEEGCQWLLDWERGYRHGLPGLPLRVDQKALAWSIRVFYHAGQMLVYRKFDEADLRRPPEECPPTPDLPESHYSVDLLGRFLPEYFRLARAVSPHDPLVDWLRQIGEDWPLSGAGIPTLRQEPPQQQQDNQPAKPSESRCLEPRIISSQPWFAHPTLRRLYLDRLINSGTGVSEDDPVLVRAFRDRLGAYGRLAPHDLRHSAYSSD